MHSALLPFQEQTNHLIKSRPKLQIQTKSNKNQLQRKSGKALYNVTESLPGDWQVVDTMHGHLIIIVVDQPNYHQLCKIIAIGRLSRTTTSVYMIK